jgi:ABC-type polysaccharide/polyol phosphate export permease
METKGLEVDSPVMEERRTLPRSKTKRGRQAVYFNIVRELAVADFRLKYHDSALGYLWSMLNPIFLFLVYHFVFSYLFVVKVPKFTFYLLSGIVFWNYFSDATLSSMSSLEGKAALAKKIYFPRILLVFSSTATALISFVINTVLLWFVVIVFDHFSANQFLIIVPFILVIFLSMALSFFLIIFFIHFRDVLQIWNVMLNVGFWLTPIVYNALTAPAPLKTVSLLNPMGRILVMLRAFLVFDDYPSVEFLVTTPLFCLLVFSCGVWFFQKHEHKITEYL